MLSENELSEVIAALGLPRELDPSLLDALSREVQLMELKADQTVFQEGDPCEAFLVALHGRIRVSKLAPDGRELLLYEVRPGEFCVMTTSCLLGRSPYTALGVAARPTRGGVVPRDLFLRLLWEVAQFREALFKTFAHRLTEVMALVEEVAFHRIDERLASLLLRDTDGREDSLSVTHQQLAGSLGCSREIVSRVLESFQQQGLVELGRKQIAVLDRERLGRIAL